MTCPSYRAELKALLRGVLRLVRAVGANRQDAWELNPGRLPRVYIDTAGLRLTITLPLLLHPVEAAMHPKEIVLDDFSLNQEAFDFGVSAVPTVPATAEPVEAGPCYRDEALVIAPAAAALALAIRENRSDALAHAPMPPLIVLDLETFTARVLVDLPDGARALLVESFAIDPARPDFARSSIPLTPDLEEETATH